MLIVFSGLPGTGKTTIAAELVSRLGACYLRIDTIEQALRDSGALAGDVGSSGYAVANQLALANLRFGGTVVVDCVNPVEESRQAWSDTAIRAGVRLFNVLAVCSDALEHRRRVETRTVDVPGLRPPSWQSVQAHDFEPWRQQPFTVDTATTPPASAATRIIEALSVKAF